MATHYLMVDPTAMAAGWAVQPFRIDVPDGGSIAGVTQWMAAGWVVQTQWTDPGSPTPGPIAIPVSTADVAAAIATEIKNRLVTLLGGH